MSGQVTVSRELMRQVIDSLEATCGHRCNAEYNPCNEQELVWQLRNALEQPTPEPVAFLHDDGYWTAAKTDAGRALNERLHFAGSTKVAVYTAPQAQQPRIGSGVTVEQTLEQWEHDFSNPMTPEQQTDWVKREREFASAQAQQPAPVQEPLFWVRLRSDGMYEGPIHNAQIEKVRKESGGWTPLYTAQQPVQPPQAEGGAV